jgi:glycosyltransferase involved in cell wall biosynthesis
MRECRSVVMVGTHPATMGGISTVVQGYQTGGLFSRVSCRYVVTHRDGSAVLKFLTALRGLGALSVALVRSEAPLVHVHLSSRASFWRKFLVCLLSMLARRPYLLHVHGSEFMQFYDSECGPGARRIVRFVFARAELVLALSDQWRENLLRICPSAHVEVLPNAVCVPAINCWTASEKASPMILFLGRLGARKGTFDLVRAFAAVLQRFPDASLVCAGDGAIEEVKSLARSLGIEKSVYCPGWLDPEGKRQALRRATVFALPSYAEGLPMALLEAMSWGLPVVATAVGGIPQVLRNGENGWMVRPGDLENLSRRLCGAIAETAVSGRMGRAARETIEDSFSLSASIERLIAIYGRFGIRSR